jgi:hypothetical protein
MRLLLLFGKRDWDWRNNMTNREFLALLEKINPMNPEEEQKLLDESFDEDFKKFLDGEDDFDEED